MPFVVAIAERLESAGLRPFPEPLDEKLQRGISRTFPSKTSSGVSGEKRRKPAVAFTGIFSSPLAAKRLLAVTIGAFQLAVIFDRTTFMSGPNQLGDQFVQKKVLEDMGIAVPEEALGFYTKDKTLFFEVLNTGDGFGKLLMNVDSEEVPLSDGLVEKLKRANCYSEKGFRLA